MCASALLIRACVCVSVCLCIHACVHVCACSEAPESESAGPDACEWAWAARWPACMEEKTPSMIKRPRPCFRSRLQPQTRHRRQREGRREGGREGWGQWWRTTIKRWELMSRNKRDISQVGKSERVKRKEKAASCLFFLFCHPLKPAHYFYLSSCASFRSRPQIRTCFSHPPPLLLFPYLHISLLYLTLLSSPSLPSVPPPSLLFQLPGGVWAEPHTSQLSSVGERSSWELSSKRWILKCSSPPHTPNLPTPTFPILPPSLLIISFPPVSFSLLSSSALLLRYLVLLFRSLNHLLPCSFSQLKSWTLFSLFFFLCKIIGYFHISHFILYFIYLFLCIIYSFRDYVKMT